MVVTFKEFDERGYKSCLSMYPDDANACDFTTVYEGEVIQTFVANGHLMLLVMDSITKMLLEVEANKCTVVER